MNWMICKVCGLVYRSPILEQPEYEKLYSNYEADIFSKVTPDEYFDKIVTLPDGKSENKEKRDGYWRQLVAIVLMDL